MKASTAKVLCAAILAALPPASAATATSRFSLGVQSLSIDGVVCTELVSWAGGDASAKVVVETSGTPTKKHLGNMAYEPIVMEVNVPLSPALQNSLSALCAGSATSQILLLTDTDGSQLQVNNAQLVEARFPALDASSRDSLRLTLVFRPGSTQASVGGANAPAGGAGMRRAISSNFRFSLAGLPGNQISRVEPFIITRAAPAGGVGAERDYAATPGATQIPDLSITLGPVSAPDWANWRNQFIVQGNSGDAQEKTGALEILGPDLQAVLLPLQLSHVGIKRLWHLPRAADGGADKYRAELYCEGMSVASTPTTGTTAGTSPTNPAPATPPPAPAAPAPTPAGPKPAETKPPASEPQKAPATGATESRPVPAEASNSATNPEDKGPRDPADFPRYPGTVRTSYRSSRGNAYTEESALYKGSSKASSVMEFYEKQLGGSGWKETSRYESDYGSSGGSKISSPWEKGNRTATLTIWDTAPSIVEIEVRLQTKL